MVNLEDLGFAKGIIFETIVSTYSSQGSPNIAAMGVLQLDSENIMIRIYKSSKTYNNLVSRRCAIINLSSDAALFYKSAIKDSYVRDEISLDLFKKGDLVDAPELKRADATIEVILSDIKDLDSERAEVYLKTKLIKIRNYFPRVYTRAFSAIIESVILATRIRLLSVGNESQKKKASKMKEKIKEFEEIVKRTAPNSEYDNIMFDLINKIETWLGN